MSHRFGIDRKVCNSCHKGDIGFRRLTVYHPQRHFQRVVPQDISILSICSSLPQPWILLFDTDGSTSMSWVVQVRMCCQLHNEYSRLFFQCIPIHMVMPDEAKICWRLFSFNMTDLMVHVFVCDGYDLNYTKLKTNFVFVDSTFNTDRHQHNFSDGYYQLTKTEGGIKNCQSRDTCNVGHRKLKSWDICASSNLDFHVIWYDHFYARCVEVRGDAFCSSFSWYWPQCWPSPFKLSFHNVCASRFYVSSCCLGFCSVIYMYCYIRYLWLSVFDMFLLMKDII